MNEDEVSAQMVLKFTDLNISSLLWHQKNELWWIEKTKRPKPLHNTSNAANKHNFSSRAQNCLICWKKMDLDPPSHMVSCSQLSTHPKKSPCLLLEAEKKKHEVPLTPMI